MSKEVSWLKGEAASLVNPDAVLTQNLQALLCSLVAA
jgi:hypothetical protein